MTPFRLIFWGVLFLTGMPAQATPDFPAPPRANVEVVSRSTTSLGMHLRIRRFEVKRSVEEVLQFYRDFWYEGFAESEMPPWRMIGSRQGDEYLNVQVQGKGANRSWGYLSVSDLPERLESKEYGVSMGESFPMMSGSKLLDDNLSKDIGKTGRTLLIQNGFSPEANASYYRSHYRNKGWQLVMDEETAPRNRGYAMYFRRGQESVALTINTLEGQTSIVANQVSRGIFGR